MKEYWVHELAMITPTSQGVYAPSRLTAPYQVSWSKLALMNIATLLVSLHPDGKSNAKLMPVLAGPITGLPRLLVYDGSFVEGQIIDGSGRLALEHGQLKLTA